jgi:hypothetical protein
MLLTKFVQDYIIKKHSGFFTVERKVVYRFLWFAYKEEWRPVQEIRKNKLLGNQRLLVPKHFATEKTARNFVNNEINSKVNFALRRLSANRQNLSL